MPSPAIVPRRSGPLTAICTLVALLVSPLALAAPAAASQELAAAAVTGLERAGISTATAEDCAAGCEIAVGSLTMTVADGTVELVPAGAVSSDAYVTACGAVLSGLSGLGMVDAEAEVMRTFTAAAAAGEPLEREVSNVTIAAAPLDPPTIVCSFAR